MKRAGRSDRARSVVRNGLRDAKNMADVKAVLEGEMVPLDVLDDSGGSGGKSTTPKSTGGSGSNSESKAGGTGIIAIPESQLAAVDSALKKKGSDEATRQSARSELLSSSSQDEIDKILAKYGLSKSGPRDIKLTKDTLTDLMQKLAKTKLSKEDRKKIIEDAKKPQSEKSFQELKSLLAKFGFIVPPGYVSAGKLAGRVRPEWLESVRDWLGVDDGLGLSNHVVDEMMKVLSEQDTVEQAGDVVDGWQKLVKEQGRVRGARVLNHKYGSNIPM